MNKRKHSSKPLKFLTILLCNLLIVSLIFATPNIAQIKKGKQKDVSTSENQNTKPTTEVSESIAVVESETKDVTEEKDKADSEVSTKGQGKGKGKGQDKGQDKGNEELENTSEINETVIPDIAKESKIDESTKGIDNITEIETATSADEPATTKGTSGHKGSNRSNGKDVFEDTSTPTSSDEPATTKGSSGHKGSSGSEGKDGSEDTATTDDSSGHKGSKGSKGEASDSDSETALMPKEPIVYELELDFDIKNVRISDYLNVYVGQTISTDLWYSSNHSFSPYYGQDPEHPESDLLPRNPFDSTKEGVITEYDFSGDSDAYPYNMININYIYPSTIEIIGKKPGTAILKIKTKDGSVKTSSLISIAANPVLPDTEVYLSATNSDASIVVDEYDSVDDVYLTVHNYSLDNETYFVKIESKGKSSFSREVTVKNGIGSNTFKLTNMYNDDGSISKQGTMDLIDDDLPADNFSKSYFVSVSKHEGFPKGDEEDGLSPKTLTDNFKITSPVPTVDIEDIHIDIKQSDSSTDGLDAIIYNKDNATEAANYVGYDVLLARELDFEDSRTAIDATVDDYPNLHPSASDSKYSDEVKAYGQIQADGSIDWQPLKETLKIGGYVLLMDLPDNYGSNLDQPNPASEDDELLCEVHLERDTPLYRTITIHELDTILEKETHRVYVGEEGELSVLSTNLYPEGNSLKWSVESDKTDILGITGTSNNKNTVYFTGLAAGTATLILSENDSIIGTCVVSVSINPAIPADEVYMSATDEFGVALDEFNTLSEIYITAHNLDRYITDEQPSPLTFHLKLEEKGDNEPILSGSVIYDSALDLSEDNTFMFKLSDVIVDLADVILPVDNFSKSYFISMSLKSTYPTGDINDIEETLSDNFKVTSPVPNGKIEIKVKFLNSLGEFIDAETINGLEGKGEVYEVLLAREIDGVGRDATLASYADASYETGYTDEVKMFGTIGPDGNIIWDEPKESLKIGGYILLFKLPNHSSSNLSSYNPYADDGSLLNEIHLKRDALFEYTYIIRDHEHGLQNQDND